MGETHASVLVAHPDCREAHKIFLALRDEHFAPSVALSDLDALACIREHKPRLLVASASLNLVARVRARYPFIGVVALTDRHSRPYGPGVPCLEADPLSLSLLFEACHGLLRPKTATVVTAAVGDGVLVDRELVNLTQTQGRARLSEHETGILLGAKQALAWVRFPNMFAAPHEIVTHPRRRELKTS